MFINNNISEAKYVEFWGPCAWKFLHSVAAMCPAASFLDENGAETIEPTMPIVQEQYSNFFQNLADVLPCSLCSDHLKEFLKTYDTKRYITTPINSLSVDKISKEVLDEMHPCHEQFLRNHGNLGLQYLVWLMHKDVNTRMKKTNVSFCDTLSTYNHPKSKTISSLADPFNMTRSENTENLGYTPPYQSFAFNAIMLIIGGWCVFKIFTSRKDLDIDPNHKSEPIHGQSRT